jgi:hypothetical protein
LILNGHPEIACPPETNLVAIFQNIGQSVTSVSESARHDDDPSARTEEMVAHAASICREVGDQVLGSYARAVGKPMWVDKSLPSASGANVLGKVYPDARFICLYRRCEDTIASLRESSPWGYDAFGVLPFVQAQPTNLVQALAQYWVDRATSIHAFEVEQPASTLRVSYEDLVTSPRETVAEILGFLEVADDERALDAALSFDAKRETIYPGDVKVRFSRTIETSSIGRGWSVPMEMVSRDLREKIDALADELGYPPVPDLKRYATEPATSLMAPEPSNHHHSAELETLLEARVSGEIDKIANGSGRRSLVKLVLTDHSEPWMIDIADGRVERGDGQAHWLALTDSETLSSLIHERSNPGVALRNSTLQVVSVSDEQTPDQFLDCVDGLVTVLRG